MDNPTGIKQILQSMIPENMGIIEGVVISVNPINITLVNDSKIILGLNSLVIPRSLTNYSISAIFGGTASGSVSGGESIKSIHFSGTIQVNNALKQGEHVYLLQVSNGKKYFILDRKG